MIPVANNKKKRKLNYKEIHIKQYYYISQHKYTKYDKLECGPMPNVMAALPNIAGALCSTPQSLAGADCSNAVQ